MKCQFSICTPFTYATKRNAEVEITVSHEIVCIFVIGYKIIQFMNGTPMCISI